MKEGPLKRDAALLLVLGCLVILLLEAPVVMASMLDDLDGPYPEWETGDSARRTPETSPANAPFPALDRAGPEREAEADRAPATVLASFRH